MMRMMGALLFGVSSLMGWQGIPLRLASLAASPLRFAKGEGNHEGCPYRGSRPLCPFGTFPPRAGESEILPINTETPNNHNPSFASWFKIPPSRSARGGAMRSERGMPCHPISEETSADYTPSLNPSPNP